MEKLNAKWNLWSLSAGLRYENSFTTGISGDDRQVRERRIRKLFPSGAITRKITETLSANLVYSYRISRPAYTSLNSFVQYYDPLTAEVGNPNLKPSFTNNFQFNLTYENQPFFTVSYSETHDDLFELILQNDASAQILRSTVNLEERASWGFKIFGPLNFIRHLDGVTGLISTYDRFQSNDLSPQLKLNKWSFGWYTQANYELPWQIDLGMSSYFTNGMLRGQIDSDWYGMLEFSLSRKFLDDKLQMNLALNKLLNRGFVGVVDYDNIDAEINANESRQNLRLSVSYNFGSKYAKKNKRNNSIPEENRIEEND
ncbi:TonB-dependent receptor [Flavobacteriaceae bacterium Ap0902]|nr:TonB-dependent receptor [Flavobacteriaceae bacterium Ap0902]